MMSNENEALRLADALRNIAADTSLSDRYCEVMSEADDELRRRHAVNAELLAVLKRALPQLIGPAYQSAVRAIAKVEGNQ